MSKERIEKLIQVQIISTFQKIVEYEYKEPPHLNKITNHITQKLIYQKDFLQFNESAVKNLVTFKLDEFLNSTKGKGIIEDIHQLHEWYKALNNFEVSTDELYKKSLLLRGNARKYGIELLVLSNKEGVLAKLLDNDKAIDIHQILIFKAIELENIDLTQYIISKQPAIKTNPRVIWKSINIKNEELQQFLVDANCLPSKENLIAYESNKDTYDKWLSYQAAKNLSQELNESLPQKNKIQKTKV